MLYWFSWFMFIAQQQEVLFIFFRGVVGSIVEVSVSLKWLWIAIDSKVYD